MATQAFTNHLQHLLRRQTSAHFRRDALKYKVGHDMNTKEQTTSTFFLLKQDLKTDSWTWTVD